MLSAIASAVSAFFGFEQRQQDKQAGIDAQTVKEGAIANVAAQGELSAAVNAPTTGGAISKRLTDGTA